MNPEEIALQLERLELALVRRARGRNYLLLEPQQEALLEELYELAQWEFERSRPGGGSGGDGFSAGRAQGFGLAASEARGSGLGATRPKSMGQSGPVGRSSQDDASGFAASARPGALPERHESHPFREIAPKSVPLASPLAEAPKPLELNKRHEPKKRLSPEEARTLDSLNFRVRGCERCGLSEERTSLVFGMGNQEADLVFVGEAPGEEEERVSKPFVGPSGRLLHQMILAMGINPEAVYLCNAIKCRPPGNRTPHPGEVEACRFILEKQLELLRPKLIVTLGNVATKALVGCKEGITEMRGRVLRYKESLLIPTYHPAYLLHKPSELAIAWEDMRLVRKTLFSPA